MKQEKGFTLIELLITILVSSIILGGIYSLFTSQNRSYASQSIMVEMNEVARMAGTVTDDIRMAGLGQKAGFQGISLAQSDRIRVLMDIDGNGTASGSTEDMTYRYDNNLQQLLRNNEIFMDNVISFSISYKMLNGTVTSTPTTLTDIREVKITMTVQTNNIDPLTYTYKTQTINLDIVPRNMSL
jgi:type IV pilus assembly protein PilW